MQWFDDDIEKLNIVLTRNLIYSSIVMVKEGIGYSLTLNNINTKEICFIPLKPKLKPKTNIIWKKNNLPNNAVLLTGNDKLKVYKYFDN